MNYISVCSGVEAASLAWKPIGFEPLWFSEIDAFPSAVLSQRYPEVPNLGDILKINIERDKNGKQIHSGNGVSINIPNGVDILIGGTPCQAFSIGGNRLGTLDPRSALCLRYTELLEQIRPRWFIWENVPGVFSSNNGEDFKCFIRKINEIGYSCAWRVLDAQYIRVDGFPYAVPQRRRRVFVVGHSSGDWRYPARVLFEQDMLYGNPKPSRIKTRQQSTTNSPRSPEETIEYLSIGNGQVHCLEIATNEIAQTLDTMHDPPAILCYESHQQDNRYSELNECSCTLNAHMGTGGNNVPLVQYTADIYKPLYIRRFTPIECERLMGFPDNYTRISWRGRPEEKCPKSYRYKACGNSMCVNVIRWLGQRIEIIDEEIGGSYV